MYDPDEPRMIYPGPLREINVTIRESLRGAIQREIQKQREELELQAGETEPADAPLVDPYSAPGSYFFRFGVVPIIGGRS